jgi:hypothetical protein
VSSAVTSGLFALGGVVLGFGLNWLATTRTRKQVSLEERERERQQRELVIAERLDEALVRASTALDLSTKPLSERYREVRTEWENAWVSYSSRLRQPELLRRYEAIGTLLIPIIVGDLTARDIPPHVVARAIANARATLACFMRGDEQLPRTAFPEPDDVRRLIREGDSRDHRGTPLQDALSEYPEPQFHPPTD